MGYSHPKAPIVLGMGLAAGLGTGIGIGFLRELLNRSIRSKRQLEQASGVPCLGLLPKVRTGAIRRSGKDRSLETRELVPRRHELAFVLRAPFSQFAEGIRSIKLSADLNLANADGGIIIGVVSSFPGEGKSTVSANLAFLAAQTGSRVLLIDCDMRNPTLTNGLAPQANAGLRQVLTESSGRADEIIWTHAATGVRFLPANTKESPENSSGLLNSPAMEQLLQAARSEYDYVILDFAPMLPVVDVRATANLVDGFFLVAEWAKTPREAVTEAVSLSSAVRAKLLGAVLNKVDIKQMRRYGDYDGKCYSQYFEQYFERAS
jgi:succinoglycan biosynthesis transport protein ExoP